MRIQRNPGESVEVDWAGDPMVYADPLTGEPRQAWVFVAALSFSAYAPPPCPPAASPHGDPT